MSGVERDGWSSRRRFSIGCLVGGLLATLAFAWMVTDGTWNFLQSGLYTDFYDVQARSLLAGHWYVPANVLTIEGIVEHHRTYMYYGPVPALLRIPVLLFTHRFDGRLTEISMLVAFVLALVFTSRVSWRARQLAAPSRRVSWGEAALAGVAVAIVGLGSPLFFLSSSAIIYHEAEIWGATLALGAFDLLTAFLVRPRISSAVGTGLLGTAAIMTRGSVGAGPVAAVGLIAAGHLAVAGHRRRSAGRRSALPARSAGRRSALPAQSAAGERPPDVAGGASIDAGADPAGEAGVDPAGARDRTRWWWLGLPDAERSRTFAAVLSLAAIVPVACYVAVNEAKFRTLYSLPLNQQVITAISASRRATLAANGGSLFGAKFIPTGLLQYLRPDRLRVTRLFPFLTFPSAATVLGHVRYDARDWASSLTATMPVLVVLGLVGCVVAFRRRRPADPAPSLALLRVPLAGAAVGTVGVLTIAFIANRYLADVAPLLVLSASAGLWASAERLRSARGAVKAAAWGALALLAVFGLWANGALTIVYQRQLRPGVTIAERASFVSLQERIDDGLFGGRPTDVTQVAKLGAAGPPGSLAIVGDCEGLYQSGGTGYQAVERSEAAGHFRMVVHIPAAGSPAWGRPGIAARPWPVLTNGVPGGADYLAAQPLPGHRLRFQYLFQGPGATWVTNVPVTVTPGSTVVLDAVLDPNIGEIAASLDGTSVFDLGYLVRDDRPFHVAANPFGGPVASTFPGGATLRPVSTPICDQLLRRLG